MRTRENVTLASVFLLGLLTAGCAKKDAPAADEAKPGESHAEVAAETAVALAQPFTETVGAIGGVEARAGHFATLSAPAPTRVTNVFTAEGKTVAKGEALVELEQSGFQSSLAAAQATLTAAQAARDRAQRLVDQGISPRKDLDQATADLGRANADVASARRLLELSVLRAPIAGVVTRLTAAIGAAVDPSQVLVEIADPAAVDVMLTVQPGDAARIKSGDRVALHAGQRESSDTLASGVVAAVAGVVDSATRSVEIRVQATSTKRALRIGETVYGLIAVAARPHAVTVPLAALVPEGDGFKVFVVDSGDVARARPVKVGGKTDTVVEILEGVKAGERVVTYGAFGVEDGAKIIAATKGAPAAAHDSAEKP